MICIISGTNRPASRTRNITRQIASIYEALDETTQLLDLALLPPDVFVGTAYERPPATFAPFAEAVLRADGLVVVTPEYNGSMPGVLKYFIDLLKFPESFDRRPVCFVGLSSGISGAVRPVEHLQQIFGYRNAHSYPDRVFLPKIHALMDEAGMIRDAELVERLRRQATGFVDFTRRLTR